MKCYDNFESEANPKLVSVEECIFNNVNSDGKGGCIYETRELTLLISRTLFFNCTSLGKGSTVYLNNKKSLLIIQKSCFTKILTNAFAGIYYAQCNTASSFLNLFFQNGNIKYSQFACIERSIFNDKQTNFSDNTALYCPCFYAQFGINAIVKDLMEINSYTKEGAMIDTNHMTGIVKFERFNCIRNRIEKDIYGIFFLLNNTNVELTNIYAFNNIGAKMFSTSNYSKIFSSFCYTDFPNPDISFQICTYTLNDFKVLDKCIWKISNGNKKLNSLCVYFSFVIIGEQL